MKKIKVLGTKPKGHPFPIISWGIRLFEWSDISHVATYIPELGQVYHAHFNTVEFVPYAEFCLTNNIVHSYEVDVADEQYSAMLDFMEEYAGDKDGYFSLLFGALIPHLVRAFFGKYINNTFARGMNDAALCSQLVRFIAKRFWHFKVKERPYAENFSTTDVLEMMKENIN